MSNNTKAKVEIISPDGYTSPDGTIHPYGSNITIPWLEAQHAHEKGKLVIIHKIE